MKQLYKAIDSDDGTPTYFYFDGKDGQTVVSESTFDSDVAAIEGFKHEHSIAHWPLHKHTRKRMLNPVLIAEWN